MIFGLLAAMLAVLNVYILKSVLIKTIGGEGAVFGVKQILACNNLGIIVGLLINNIASIVIRIKVLTTIPY